MGVQFLQPPSPNPKQNRVNADITPPQFCKFKTDCMSSNVSLTFPKTSFMQLYSSCYDYVQKSLANAFNDFLPSLKSNYSKHSKPLLPKNSTVPYIAFILAPQFDLMNQSGEFIEYFVVRLKSAVTDCKYVCPNCQHKLSTIQSLNSKMSSLEVCKTNLFKLTLSRRKGKYAGNIRGCC